MSRKKALKQYAGTNDAYKVMMKTLRPIEAISNGEVLNNTINRLSQFMNKNQLSDDNSVGRSEEHTSELQSH